MRRGLPGLLLLAGAAAAKAQPEARFDWFDYRGSHPAAERPLAPGQFRNPILSGFYPDPSITRAGDDFYLVGSTFAYFPGLPVFHSRDLVHWRQIGNAIDRPGQLDFGRLGLSRGVFAPSIDHTDGLFYIFNTCVDCGGNFVITARNPAGPWSEPVWLPDLEGGIDPSMFVDEDGRAWIVNNGPPEGTPRYQGHRAIWVQEFDREHLRTFGPRRVLVDRGVNPAANPIWIEGPHILKRDGYYYLLCAEGGTAVGHSQVALRSRSVTGPYEPNPTNPIMTQRDLPADRPRPITSAGHADLVQLPDGSWWATFLAVQPYRGNFYNTGRETFLLPVRWEGGWPRITAPGQAIPRVLARPNLPVSSVASPPVREEFAGGALGPEWMMVRNPRTRWYRLAGGALRLQAQPVALGEPANPAFLVRRQQHMNAVATTQIRFTPQRDGDEAGLAAFQNEEYWYFLAVSREGGRAIVKLERRAGPADPVSGTTLASAPLGARPGRPVRLRFTAEGGTYRAAYAIGGGGWRPIGGDLDGTILSTSTAGGFVGAVFGLHAARGATTPR